MFCFYHNRNKFDSRSRKCIFLSFKTGIKGCIVLDIKTREIFISRDVIFDEETFIQLDNKDEQLDSVNENMHLENASSIYHMKLLVNMLMRTCSWKNTFIKMVILGDPPYCEKSLTT